MDCIKGATFLNSRILQSITRLQSDNAFIDQLWQSPPAQMSMIGGSMMAIQT